MFARGRLVIAPTVETEQGVDNITISQIISICDSLRPNPFPQELKESWLEDLEGRVYIEIFKSHENCPERGEQLLVPQPFARDLYCYYLQSRMDFENGETGRYNQSAALFNECFEAFKNHYNSQNLPLSQGDFKLRGDAKCPVSPF